ncbi:MAG: phage tail protein [Pseudomonadota bacterium]
MADLNNSSWSETDASNNSAPPAGWPTGMFPNQVEPTAQAMMGALKRMWGRLNGVYTSTGAAGVYAVAPSNASYPVAYVQGERFSFKAHQNSQGGDTLNWASLGAKPIYRASATGAVAISAGDIAVGIVEMFYDAALNSGAGGFWLGSPPLASLGAPSGSIMQFAGATAPSGWALCAGQAISRTSFATLFAVIGTTYGAGDGSTTFNLPDLRGRAIAGVDNMGGTAANRITVGASGIAGTTLGAAGGDQNLQSHGHGVNDPSHAHGVSDPGHVHGPGDGTAFASLGSGITALGGSAIGRFDTTAAAATGIGIFGAFTGISIQGAGSGGGGEYPADHDAEPHY